MLSLRQSIPFPNHQNRETLNLFATIRSIWLLFPEPNQIMQQLDLDSTEYANDWRFRLYATATLTFCDNIPNKTVQILPILVGDGHPPLIGGKHYMI